MVNVSVVINLLQLQIIIYIIILIFNNFIYFLTQFTECLLDQKAPQYIEYEPTNFAQHLDVVSQATLPITKVQVAADYQHGDSSFTLQQLTPPQSPPQFDGQQQQLPSELLKEEQKVVVSKRKRLSLACRI